MQIKYVIDTLIHNRIIIKIPTNYHVHYYIAIIVIKCICPHEAKCQERVKRPTFMQYFTEIGP